MRMTSCESRRATSADGDAGRLVTLCCAVYFTSYLTRKCYEASILSICDDTGLARTVAGLAGAAAVALYGAGQFVTGLMADRLDARKIVLAALLLTAACNAAMPAAAAGGAGWLIAVNAVNGFAQAMFWPPLVKILAGRLDTARYKGAVFAVNIAANVALIAVFALVAGCIRFSGWHWGFATVAAFAIAVAAVWWRASSLLGGDPSRMPRQDGFDEAMPSCSPPLAGLRWLLPVALAIICLGALRDGIEAWAPAIMSDRYGLGASNAVFSVALLPVFAVASMVAARALRRRLGDEVKAALTLFAVGLACALALLLPASGHIASGLPLLSLLSATMHGANLMLVCELPGRFAATGRVGTISGALNACVYVGASISIYGFAALREHFASWNPVFGIWALLLSLAVALCSAAFRSRK